MALFQGLTGITDILTGHSSPKIKGSVVLMRKNVLDFTDYGAKLIDDFAEFLGQSITFQLVSATVGDHTRGNRGKVGKVAYLQQWFTNLAPLAAGETSFSISFDLEAGFGIPGAVIVNNNHANQFFLKTLTLDDVPGKGRIVFVCNSWVYPAFMYKFNRVFFANDTYIPSSTPAPLQPYREDELLRLRGDDVTGQLQEYHRVYGYALYNDLGDTDKGADHVRPTLGGTKEYPYPRRGRTGRHPSRTDPSTESRLFDLNLDIYVPRDERFGHIKMSDFLTYAIKGVVQGLLPILISLVDKNFDSFQEVMNLYTLGLPMPNIPGLSQLIPFEMFKEILRSDGERLLRYPTPQVIKDDNLIWRTDEQFVREMLAGSHPLMIKRLQEFPPKSKLDPSLYGNQDSTITAAQIQNNLYGQTVGQALENNKLFILDHHDLFMQFVKRINTNTPNNIYATRTLLFLKDDGTLKPLAIELSLPHPDGEQHGAVSVVYLPADSGVDHSLWQLAKAYAVVNDYGVHEAISHWLHTHAVIEPFVLATNRHLSVVHPIYKLLFPHYRDTMNINALARQALVNEGGVLERNVCMERYTMEMSSVAYKEWKLTEQSLPDDLIKRGVAVEDLSKPNKIRLLIEDYPYAVDGLAIWSAIETWVTEYCCIYYPNDAAIQADPELQAWWKEVREVGHADKKDETWWPTMQTLPELTKTCSTIIWVASALHAAVNFGQYAFAGFPPNRPFMTRKLMPQQGSPDFEELKSNPDKVYLHTISDRSHALLGMTLLEVLSRHASDEVYLGQRDSPDWTSDQRALDVFNSFTARLIEIEKKIVELNQDNELKNRKGYMLQYPNTSDHTGIGGLTGKGIPNSISI